MYNGRVIYFIAGCVMFHIAALRYDRLGKVASRETTITATRREPADTMGRQNARSVFVFVSNGRIFG